jgi:hypothetical protein
MMSTLVVESLLSSAFFEKSSSVTVVHAHCVLVHNDDFGNCDLPSWLCRLLFHGLGTSPSASCISRREHRRLDKQAWRHRHDRGRRLPALLFLPILWMAMTNVIMIPMRVESPIASLPSLRQLSSQLLYHFGQHSTRQLHGLRS